jgi:hypothetical protein
MLSFTSAQLPDAPNIQTNATVQGVEAPGTQALAVTKEGALKATNSRLRQLRSVISFVGPSRAVADPTLLKTAWSRQNAGDRGLGILGGLAAQASVNAATGFSYFGAAQRFYGAFIMKGHDVSLPENTTLLIRIDE